MPPVSAFFGALNWNAWRDRLRRTRRRACGAPPDEPRLSGSTDLLELFPQLPTHPVPWLDAAPRGPGALTEFAELATRAARGEADAKRYCRALEVLGANEAEGQVWMIAPAYPGAGASSTAAALAGACAAQGRRVVLVDADLHRRRLHAAFNVAASPGLAEILLGTASWPQALRPLDAHRFLLLPSGAAPLDAETLARPAMADTLRELRSYYDLVLIALPAQAPVAPGLLAQADRVLGVARVGQSPLAACTALLQAALAEQVPTHVVVVEAQTRRGVSQRTSANSNA
jgi:Mrp family chromosome partitioning ATPase